MIDTQRNQILKHLQKGNSLTPLDAWKKFGCSKISTRCSELRRLFGVNIQSRWKRVKTKFGETTVKEYFLLNQNKL